MIIDRRTLLTATAASLVAAATPRSAAAAPPSAAAIKAVAFDAFPILDPRSIAKACEREFPQRGQELMNAWRTRQFEYQWLRALGDRYEDFWSTTAAALEHACESLGLDASPQRRDALMQEYLQLDVWPDVPAALRALMQRGLRLALLSNATTTILENGIRRAGLAPAFDQVISTDRIRTFKPDPRAYQLGVEVLGLRREEILFVAFAGWDAVGAKWFGYPTFWNNRLGAADERLGVAPDGRGRTLDDLLKGMGWPMGLEPTTAEITTRGSTN